MKTKKSITLVMLLVSILIISSMTTYAANTEKVRKIVVFSTATSDVQKSNILKKHHADKIKDLDSINGIVVSIYKNNKMSEEIEIQYVEDDFIISIDGKKKKPDPIPVPAQLIPWGIEYMEAPSHWSDSTDNLKIGIIDTGIDLDHPDLQVNIKGGVNTISQNKSVIRVSKG